MREERGEIEGETGYAIKCAREQTQVGDRACDGETWPEKVKEDIFMVDRHGTAGARTTGAKVCIIRLGARV
jgi:hypothetical protein